MFFRKKQQLTPARIILIGFALLILAGALLLTVCGERAARRSAIHVLDEEGD